MKKITLLIVFFALFFMTNPEGLADSNDYKVYILEYAYLRNYSIKVLDKPYQQLSEFPLQIIYIENKELKALFGTGIGDFGWAQRFVPLSRKFVPLEEMFRRISNIRQEEIDPSKIDVVIIPNMSYYNISAIPLFSNATFYIQTQDLEDTYSPDVRTQDVNTLFKLIGEGKVEVIDGDTEITFEGKKTGIKLYRAPAGSLGSIFLTLKTESGPILLGGEVTHTKLWFDLIAEYSPDIYNYIRELMKDNEISEDFLIPAHDTNTQRFPKIAEGIYEVRRPKEWRQ